jgi:hypothetical protein
MMRTMSSEADRPAPSNKAGKCRLTLTINGVHFSVRPIALIKALGSAHQRNRWGVKCRLYLKPRTLENLLGAEPRSHGSAFVLRRKPLGIPAHRTILLVFIKRGPCNLDLGLEV